MPGFEVAVLNEELKPVPPNTPGVLAVDRLRSPLFTFVGYWRAETPSLRGNWYLTGDIMQRDEDGHFFFVGRNDDIITSAGYRASRCCRGSRDRQARPGAHRNRQGLHCTTSGIRWLRCAGCRYPTVRPYPPFPTRLSARDRVRAGAA